MDSNPGPRGSERLTGALLAPPRPHPRIERRQLSAQTKQATAAPTTSRWAERQQPQALYRN